MTKLYIFAVNNTYATHEGKKGNELSINLVIWFPNACEVLVNPVPVDGERWQVAENKDEVSLWFDVPGLSPADLIVEIDEDVLVIKKNKKASPKSNYNTPTSGAIADHQEATADEFSGGGIYARLLLPAGYSREGVQAKLTSGELKLTIGKVKESVRRQIKVDISDK